MNKLAASLIIASAILKIFFATTAVYGLYFIWASLPDFKKQDIKEWLYISVGFYIVAQGYFFVIKPGLNALRKKTSETWGDFKNTVGWT